MKKNITAIIDRSKDGLFCCYTIDKIPHFGIAGYGDTPQEAIDDFFICYEEIKELEQEAGRKAPELTFTFRYDLNAFFAHYTVLNISQLAQRAGINASQLRQFASGKVNAGEKHRQKLKAALQALARELDTIEF